MRYLLASTVAVAALFALPASANSISGLVGTGAGLAANAVDTNYSFAALSGTATGTGGFGVVANPASYPFPYWVPNTASSQWLAPAAPASTAYDPSVNGTYKWTLTFNLGSGYDSSTAAFAARWSADNLGFVQLNGATLAGSVSSSHNTWQAFSASSGFHAGANTLAFFVTNLAQAGNNPTGLQVQFLSSTIAPVPEPESYAMLLAGLGLIVTIIRRRNKSRTV